jgi:hypothetical protein
VTRTFAVTWDYRCPFARNAHEHLLDGQAGGADWEVTYLPFSLNQVHVEEGQPPVWDNPDHAPALLAMQAGIAVRDEWPDAFPRVHRALFTARHDDGLDLRDRQVIEGVLVEQGVDAAAVFEIIAGGQPLATFRKEHEAAAANHHVWGVPTFIADGRSVFIRLMHRPQGDSKLARETIDRVVDLVVGWPELNEFKHTSIPR